MYPLDEIRLITKRFNINLSCINILLIWHKVNLVSLILEAELKSTGFPAYTTSCGWLDYPDDKIRKVLFYHLI